MARNPFGMAADKVGQDQSTEFGWGPGMAPRMDIDFSQGGFKSGFPIADPDRRQQLLDLAAHKRTDLQNPAEPELPAFTGGSGAARIHYEMGNTERYGAQAPLVEARARPRFRRAAFLRKSRMRRSQEGGLANDYVPIQDPNMVQPGTPTDSDNDADGITYTSDGTTYDADSDND